VGEIMESRNAERNRQMLAAFEAGRSVEGLAADYGLTLTTVRSILTGERHKRRVSPEPYYRSFREF
jgi:Mor family transcriptional regulator